MTRVILLRHGQTEWNAAGRIQGSTDTPLGDEGERQATLVAASLASHLTSPVRVLSSPLARAHSTAAIVAAAFGADVSAEPRFTQRSYGAWEGMEYDAIAQEFPDEHARWRAREDPRVDGYEGEEALASRVRGALTSIAAEGTDAVVVSHGSVIRTAIHASLGLGDGYSAIGKVSNCEWSELAVRGDAWTLVRHAIPLPPGG